LNLSAAEFVGTIKACVPTVATVMPAAMVIDTATDTLPPAPRGQSTRRILQ
jgi:hypothetical protein